MRSAKIISPTYDALGGLIISIKAKKSHTYLLGNSHIQPKILIHDTELKAFSEC